MQQAKKNDTVVVTYDGMLDNGELFESSEDTGPLAFTIGNNEVFPAFEDAVIGMEVGQTKSFKVQPEDAYGPKRQDLIIMVNRDAFGDNEPGPGMVMGVTIEKDGEKHQVPALVVEVDADKGITVDFNHPLAGETLTYNVTLQGIDQPEK